MTRLTEPTKFVTFRLDRELYALSIDQVREVLDFTDMTKVPRMPEFMRGVINLRGSVVPVVDLRLKFGIEPTPRTVETRIIIVEITVDGESTILGALADSVSEVIELEPDQIGPAPRIGTRLRTEFIRGMGRKDDEFIIILNVDQVFSTDELAVVQAVEQSAAGARIGSDDNAPEEPAAAF
ncbi:MAG: chemotaxis protein CheW [Proteobacteria bacterium]|nr:chemotaxis protein CheW [Pseudomonadota bacterium]